MLTRALAGCSVIGLVAACHHAPPPAPPAAERALTKPGDLAGSWVTSDDLDWGYTLVIDAAGGYKQRIERGRMGLCEQTGALTAGAAPRAFALAFKKDTCDEGGPGATRTFEVESFTAGALVVTVRGGVSPLHRRYTPDPKASPVQ